MVGATPPGSSKFPENAASHQNSSASRRSERSLRTPPHARYGDVHCGGRIEQSLHTVLKPSASGRIA
jgi:hypothetical protein